MPEQWQRKSIHQNMNTDPRFLIAPGSNDLEIRLLSDPTGRRVVQSAGLNGKRNPPVGFSRWILLSTDDQPSRLVHFPLRCTDGSLVPKHPYSQGRNTAILAVLALRSSSTAVILLGRDDRPPAQAGHLCSALLWNAEKRKFKIILPTLSPYSPDPFLRLFSRPEWH